MHKNIVIITQNSYIYFTDLFKLFWLEKLKSSFVGEREPQDFDDL